MSRTSKNPDRNAYRALHPNQISPRNEDMQAASGQSLSGMEQALPNATSIHDAALTSAPLKRTAPMSPPPEVSYINKKARTLAEARTAVAKSQRNLAPAEKSSPVPLQHQSALEEPKGEQSPENGIPHKELPQVGFLSLPKELRDMIYKETLIRDEPIDLWPDQIVRDHRSMSPRKCAARHYHHTCHPLPECICEWKLTGSIWLKFREAFECQICNITEPGTVPAASHPLCQKEIQLEGYVSRQKAPYYLFQEQLYIHRGRGGKSPITLFVRRQRDLCYVRKEMATGLLTTCKQVHAEASPYFWGENHFIFSGSGGWQGLLRFLLTIGPAARRQIRFLDLPAPFRMDWLSMRVPDEGKERILDGRSKNDPKLRMVKIRPEAPGPGEASYVRQVIDFTVDGMTLQRLNLVIPGGCYTEGFEDINSFFFEPAFECDGPLSSPSVLRRLKAAEINLVVEGRAFLHMDNAFSFAGDLGWNLVCHLWSYVYIPGQHILIGGKVKRLHQQQTWVHHKYGYLEGIPTLFGAEEDFEDLNNDAADRAWTAAEQMETCDVLQDLRQYWVYAENYDATYYYY
ncbi:MAG: hypothetical protein L6R39_001763 [Caloplaca ligustica]|nr:MAG: hypothetical protein L6R39_001763 [Caloplaca ligustica]